MQCDYVSVCRQAVKAYMQAGNDTSVPGVESLSACALIYQTTTTNAEPATTTFPDNTTVAAQEEVAQQTASTASKAASTYTEAARQVAGITTLFMALPMELRIVIGHRMGKTESNINGHLMPSFLKSCKFLGEDCTDQRKSIYIEKICI